MTAEIIERSPARDEERRVLRALRSRAECARAVLRARSVEFLFREVCRAVVGRGYHACAVHRDAADDRRCGLIAAAGAAVAPSIGAADGSVDGDRARLTPAESVLVDSCGETSNGDPQGARVARFLGRPAGEAAFVLSVYDVDPSAFDDLEVAELRELVRDLVVGVERVARCTEGDGGGAAAVLQAPSRTTASSQAESALREQLELTRTITDSAEDAIVMIDDRGRIIYWNRAATEIFGWEYDEAMGRDLHRLLAPDRFRELQSAAFRRFAETGDGDAVGRVVELVGRRRDGSEFPMELSLASTRLRGRWAAVGIVRDITDRKRTMQELERAKADAEKAVEAKSLFLANMSHEIRTPLNAVIGMTDLLLDTELDQQQRDFVKIVHRAGESLLSVINDILDFSKMDADALEFEEIPFSVRTCVEEVGDILAQKAAAKGIELVILIDHQVPRRVIGDPGRLRQVLTNLINNAIKFTESGEVVVRVGVLAREGERCRLQFSVRDTGIGIPADRIPSLFQPFTQVDASTTRRFGGTGLGLSITKKLVERMGGTVEVESEVGRGSVFTCSAVFSVAADDGERRPTIQHGSIRGKKALIVDDNKTNRMLLRELLERWGCSSVSVASGPEALRILHDSEARPDFDLAILDYSMPSMDGASLAREIKASETSANIPLVLLTSMPEFGDGDRMREAGFDAYLTKPVKQSLLFDAIVSVTSDDGPEPPEERQLVTRHTIDEERRARLRILVAEDNVVNQKVISKMLESLGFRCDVADNGKEAVEALERQPYDVVFMDCQMPVMDGFEATRAIRAMAGVPKDLPIIATTAEALKGDRERCLEAGMTGYISKPIDRDELAAVLDGLVEAPQVQSSPSPEGRGERPGSADECDVRAEPPVDIDRIRQISRGDRDFERRILTLYADESVKRAAAIAAGLDKGDFDALREDAHAMKGSAGNIGADRVSEAAGRLQRAAETGDENECRELVAALLREHQSVDAWLRRYLADPGAAEDGGAE